jgi:hypothetical protein
VHLSEQEFQRLAHRTDGFSGSDIQNTCRDALMQPGTVASPPPRANCFPAAARAHCGPALAHQQHTHQCVSACVRSTGDLWRLRTRRAG